MSGAAVEPDASLGGLDEDVWRARAIADDESRHPYDRERARLYAAGVAHAVAVLTGKVVAVTAGGAR